MAQETPWIRWFDDLGADDTSEVGGKNASLGEMVRALKETGVRVPDGFATTAAAYRAFLEANALEKTIREQLDAYNSGDASVAKAGKAIRRAFLEAPLPEQLEKSVRNAYKELCERYGTEELGVAIRSSATAEDLPEASFAGQQESFLNITGAEECLEACRKCYASLFTDRAIAYREEQGFDHFKVALSVGVQKMVRADRAGSGVMFSIDTETGFPDVIVIDAAWGLGENVVQGTVNPDEYTVFKPLLDKEGCRPILGKKRGEKEKKMVYATKGDSHTTQNVDTSQKERNAFVLSDDEILQLARWASAIEKHYERPMDMEWAKDGETPEIFIVQARPETVQSQQAAGHIETYRLEEEGTRLTDGLAVGEAIAAAKACVIKSANNRADFQEGAILVTGVTDPDWVPIMKKARGIVTDHGGRTSHAAIVSRELGIPAVVGTGDGTEAVADGQAITVSCAEGERGYVYEGELEYTARDVDLEDIPKTRTQLMMNIASPAGAFRWWRLPTAGIGLARMEFIINNVIAIHPMALVHFDSLEDEEAKRRIETVTRGYADKTDYFVDKLAQGIGRIAAPAYPKPAIVRMSDFKTNEYAELIGGQAFEPEEANPMLGWRGAARYHGEGYREGFALECRAIKRVREDLGLDNVILMIPFCRTIGEAGKVLETLEENGLKRGENGLEIYVMAEIPANILLAKEFAEHFDGFSIGTNDLTQLTLGADRDTAALAEIFDARDPAVKRSIEMLIDAAHEAGRKVGICGQAPSDHPDFAEFLVSCGIDSISVNPDSLTAVTGVVAEAEAD